MSRESRNPFDGLDPRKALDAFLNSTCPHGYSKRKNCSKCQTATRSRADKPAEGRKRGRSVYER
jgi:hypothetical protein